MLAWPPGERGFIRADHTGPGRPRRSVPPIPPPPGGEQRLRRGLALLDSSPCAPDADYRQVPVAFCAMRALVGPIARAPGLWKFSRAFSGRSQRPPCACEQLAADLAAALQRQNKMRYRPSP